MLTRHARVLAGSLLALGGGVLLAALSRAPQRMHSRETAALRLSWSARPARIEVCREVPEDELRKLPQHMRQPVICEGQSAEYRLTVTQDGDTLAHDRVHGGGVRRDRPLYLYRDFAIAPGTHDIAVHLERIDSAGTAVADDSIGAPPVLTREEAEVRDRTGHRLSALPSSLEVSRRLSFAARRVVLVTYDQDRRVLLIREAPER